jgi:phosphoglucomutase
MENGGPAPESVTNQIFIHTTTIKEYFIAEDLPEVQVFIGLTNLHNFVFLANKA